jgi:hypothetical protein
MRHQCARFLPIVLLVLLASITGSGATAGGAPADLVQNGGFEQEELGSVAMWSTSAWVPADAAVRFFVTEDAKHGGSRSFAIANLQPNDSRLMQWIAVKPGTHYRISCWIYAQGIDTPSIGANISVLGATIAAGDVRDTAGKWQLVELYGKTGPRQRAVAVLARLGFYGSLATGLALFDDFSVEELPGPPAGKTVSSLETTDMVVVQPLPPSPEPTTVTGKIRASLAVGIPTYLAIALGVLVLAAIVVAVFALASALVTRRYGPVTAAASGRIPIAALVGGSASRPVAAGRLRGGRRRGAAHEIEHRSWSRDALDSPITVRRRRRDGGIDTFRMRTANVSEGGLFLASEDISLLALDDEVSLEVLRDGAKVELGRAWVVRAVGDGFAIRLAAGNARIRLMLHGAS